MSAYSACFSLPCAVLGLREAEGRVVGIDFLPPDNPSQAPRTPLAREVCRQLEAWLAAPAFPFDLPLAPGGTPFQNRYAAAVALARAGLREDARLQYRLLAKASQDPALKDSLRFLGGQP